MTRNMLAIVDVGNTNIKFTLYVDGEFSESWYISTYHERTASELYAILRVLASQANINIHHLVGAAVSSVVAAVNGSITEMFKSFFNIVPVFITSAHASLLGINICLAQNTIGSDRLADIVAARTLYPDRDLLVIDMGTITVFNLVNKNGDLYGQVLSPGLACLVKSVRLCTAALPQVCVNKPTTKVISDATASSLESGLYWGYLSMVEGVIQRILKEESGKSLHIVATGGASNFFRDSTHVLSIDKLLTTKGILQIYRKLIENEEGR
ncbi:type III pantothenate kinase [Anaplasma phagocytophilum]|uniref:type III pantothenate kinase n=1 Tax=Anaplasma phagocytophilum TaxID=948 RepID=UPI001E5A20DB|nr:type III pantothenate kinase [Anaplasma phagocytophilum]